MNRKLIRPNLAEYKQKMKGEPSKKRPHPSYETFAENYYYLKQMNKKTPIAVVFLDGEEIEGIIEWYDKNCIKLNREKKPNLLLYKNCIKYLYKLEDRTEAPQKKTVKRPIPKKKI